MIVTGAPTIVRESWGSVKTFEFGQKKWVKRPLTYETLRHDSLVISNCVCWKPGQFSFKHTKTFHNILVRLGTGASDTKK